MTRYTTATGPEGEYEPGSRHRVLKNLLGIKLKSDMDRAELRALNTAQQHWFLEGIVTDQTQFTSAMIRRMHKDWLGEIYEWAGNYRTVDMSKGGFAFPPAYLIDQNMRRMETEVLSKLTPCKPGPISEVCYAVAVVHAELLLIHPFRDGNGRIARWLAHMMFAQAGRTMPKYGFVGKGSERRHRDYINAVVKGYGQNYSDLAAFFEDALERRLHFGLNSDSERGDAPSNMDDS